jgi:hypothetical protein
MQHGRWVINAMKLLRFDVGAGATLLGLAAVAASIAFTFRWNIAPTREGAARLDRWTGQIVECRYEAYRTTNKPREPRKLDCNVAQGEVMMMLPLPESTGDFERRMRNGKE